MSIKKIVITGGPCAGKTTAQSWIQNSFAQKGYVVLFVPETATELITGGVAPWTCGTNIDYQKFQFRLQIEKEDIYRQAAETMNTDKVLIVCDRGLLDNKAYMSQEDFDTIATALGSSEIELRERYDAVFHLITAADGAEAFYTTANNQARRESPEEAIELDRKLANAWTGHQHMRIIDNSTDFEGKMQRLLREIASFLGEPEIYSTERRFIISYPDVSVLEAYPNSERVEIIQTYLKPNENGVSRVRQRGSDGHYIYYQVTHQVMPDGSQIEIERRLSQNEYLRLLMEADTTRRQLRKTRYYLTHQDDYFEIDIYPLWNDGATLAIKVLDSDAPIDFPEIVHVVQEITDHPDALSGFIDTMPKC